MADNEQGEREDLGEGDSTLAGGDERGKAAQTREGGGREKRRGDICLRAASGVVIHHSLPLHPAIDDQWRKGELSRVDDDGMPWEGDEYDVSDALDRRSRETWEASGDPHENLGEDDIDREDDDEDDTEPVAVSGTESAGFTNAGTPQEPTVNKPGAIGEPTRPADGAPLKSWREFAVAIGAATADEAQGMSRAELVRLCTPPETDPLAEGR